MRLQTETQNNMFIIEVPALDLDASNADEFKKSAGSIIKDQINVLLDLKNVGFMDSAGLGAVISIFRNIKANGGSFRACSLSPEVKALFDLVHIQRLFDICEDRESAAAASA